MVENLRPDFFNKLLHFSGQLMLIEPDWNPCPELEFEQSKTKKMGSERHMEN